MLDIRHAIAQGQPQKALRLLRRSIRDKRCAKNGLTYDLSLLLHHAIEHSTPGILPFLRFLVQRGADVNVELQQRTPLWYAIQHGDENMVRFVLDHGAHLNRKDRDDQTPMHHAVQAGSAVLVELLLRAGAALHYKDHAVLTPIDYAAYTNREDLVSLIEQLAPQVGPAYLQYVRRERIILIVLAYNRADYIALDLNDIERPVILGSPDCGWLRHAIAEVVPAHGACMLPQPYHWLVPMLAGMRTDGHLNFPKLFQLGETCGRTAFRIVRVGSNWPEGW